MGASSEVHNIAPAKRLQNSAITVTKYVSKREEAYADGKIRGVINAANRQTASPT